MSSGAGVALVRNKAEREAELRATRLTLTQLLMLTGSIARNDEALEQLDLVKLQQVVADLARHKERITALRAEYRELAALASER